MQVKNNWGHKYVATLRIIRPRQISTNDTCGNRTVEQQPEDVPLAKRSFKCVFDSPRMSHVATLTFKDTKVLRRGAG